MAEACHRLIDTVELVQGGAQVDQCINMVGIAFQGFSIVFAGAFVVAQRGVHRAPVVPSLGVSGSQRHGRVETASGLLTEAHRHVQAAKIVVGVRQTRVKDQRRPVCVQRFVKPIQRLKGSAQIVVGLG